MIVKPIGVCRFSILTTGGFKSGPKEDMAARQSYLFDESRISERLAWLEHVTLPSIRNQRNKKFVFIILASDLLPEKYKSLLLRAVGWTSNIKVKFCPVGRHVDICNAALKDNVGIDADVVAQFRLDDDDALSFDYIDRIYNDFSSKLHLIYKAHGMVACDYTNGFILEASRYKSNLHKVSTLHLTCAQTLYISPGAEPGLFSWGHHQLYRHMPTITFNNGNMFVRGKNYSNDSSFKLGEYNSQAWDLEVLKRRFDIDVKALQKALSRARY